MFIRLSNYLSIFYLFIHLSIYLSIYLSTVSIYLQYLSIYLSIYLSFFSFFFSFFLFSFFLSFYPSILSVYLYSCVYSHLYIYCVFMYKSRVYTTMFYSLFFRVHSALRHNHISSLYIDGPLSCNRQSLQTKECVKPMLEPKTCALIWRTPQLISFHALPYKHLFNFAFCCSTWCSKGQKSKVFLATVPLEGFSAGIYIHFPHEAPDVTSTRNQLKWSEPQHLEWKRHLHQLDRTRI